MNPGSTRTRTRRSACKAVLAMVVGLASGGVFGNDSTSGAKAMSSVQISVELAATRWVMGTRFLAKIRVHNGGSAPIDVPTPVGPSEFEFRVSSQALQIARILSAETRRQSRYPDPVPDMRSLQPLPAGATAEYTEDLGDYAQPPLPPGAYQVLVRWLRAPVGTLQSAETPVDVVTARTLSMVTATDTAPALALLSAVEDAQGGVRLMAWCESAGSQTAPGAGSGGCWATIGAPQAPPLSLAAASYDSRSVRWYGWWQGGALHTGVAQANTVFVNPPPVPLDLPEAQLHATGWQAHNEQATWLVLGAASAGAAPLATVTVDGDGTQQVVMSTLATGGPVQAWSAQRASGDGAAARQVVTATGAGGRTQLIAHTLAADGTTLGSTPLATRGEALQTLALAPLPPRDGGTPFVDALFGPTGTPPRMTFLRLPLDGQPATVELALPVPMDGAGRPASDWTLAPTDAPVAQLVARLGDQLIGKVLTPGGRGFVLARDAVDAHGLRLERVGHVWWALWIDPALGTRSARLPDLAEPQVRVEA